MLTNPQPPRIHLPKGWQDCVQSAVLHAIALAHYAIVYARAWAADSINARVRLAAENDRLHEACALLREELRIKDKRVAQTAPQRRTHYGPHDCIDHGAHQCAFLLNNILLDARSNLGRYLPGYHYDRDNLQPDKPRVRPGESW